MGAPRSLEQHMWLNNSASKARTKRTTMTSAQRSAFLRCVCGFGVERGADVYLGSGAGLIEQGGKKNKA
jgi:hypothetical protein